MERGDLMTALKKLLNVKYLVVLNIALLVAIKIVIPLSGSSSFLFQSALIENSNINSRDIITETNKVRVAQGLSPLNANTELDLAAANKLADMVKNNYFAHTSPEGVSPWYWIGNSGYKYTYAGENLALGFNSAQETLNAWMDSPTHRANLLNDHYQEIGVAVGNANLNGVSGILVVQTFGRPYAAPLAEQPSHVATKTIAVAQTVAVGKVSGASDVQQPASTNSKVSQTQPTQITKADSLGLFKDMTSYGYSIYLLIIITITMLIGIMEGFQKKSLSIIGVHLGLLIIVAVLPGLTFVAKSLIF